MKKPIKGRLAVILFVAFAVLGSTVALAAAINASQNALDGETIQSPIVNWDNAPAYEIPEAASSQSDYQGPSTTELMPHDLTFTQADVPFLMDKLATSDYQAVYADNDMCLRVTKNHVIEYSEDAGTSWAECITKNISPDDFATWLLQNDPIPGYSIREMQNRLSDGADVQYIAVDDSKEFYFVIDENGVQIELVQREKINAILIDGQRMMFTSVQSAPLHISKELTESFYELLVANNIITENEAQQDCAERLEWIGQTESAHMIVNS